MLDTIRKVTTPELIELHLRPAGILPRALAFMLDELITILALIIFSIVALLIMGYEVGIGVSFLMWFAVSWFYPVLCEVLFGGQTIGKRAFNIVVLNDDGTPIGWGASITRNLLRVVDFLPFFYFSGIISILIHKEFRRLGDVVANTIVCYRTRSVTLPKIATVEPIMPNEALSRDAQRALLAFAQRANNLTTERQNELANLVPHLSKSQNSEVNGAPRLLGLASFLIGGAK